MADPGPIVVSSRCMSAWLLETGWPEETQRPAIPSPAGMAQMRSLEGPELETLRDNILRSESRMYMVADSRCRVFLIRRARETNLAA